MSTTENYDQDDILSFLAAIAVIKNRGGKLVAGRKVENCNTAGERSIGVVLDTNDSLDAHNLDVGIIYGPAFKKIESGAAFNDLDPLAMGVDGRYSTAVAGQVVCAFAMEQAGGAGEQRLAFILPMGQYRMPSANIVNASTNNVIDNTNAGTVAATAKTAIDALATTVNQILAVLDAQGQTL